MTVAAPSTSRAPGGDPDGENQVLPPSAEIASSDMSPVEFQFQASVLFKSDVTVTQYCVPAVSCNDEVEMKIGGLFEPKVPKAVPASVKLVSTAPG